MKTRTDLKMDININNAEVTWLTAQSSVNDGPTYARLARPWAIVAEIIHVHLDNGRNIAFLQR